MNLRTALILLLALVTVALALRTAFLLVARKPVLGYVVGSSLSDWTRLSHRGWQLAMIGDALSAGDAPEPTDDAMIRVRYTVEGREYFKDMRTVVRKGERPEPTLRLWYDPRDPKRVTDKGISWLGLVSLIALLVAAGTGLI